MTMCRDWIRRVSMPRENHRPTAGRVDPEGGQITLLILGFTVIALMLIIGAVDVTAVQLARTRLLDVADSAALDASDALDSGSAYGAGLSVFVPITDGSVRESAARYLGASPDRTASRRGPLPAALAVRTVRRR